MKTCNRCKSSKSLNDFGSSKRSVDGKLKICKSCKNQYAKVWYESNKIDHIKRVYKNKSKTIKENRQKLFDLLKTSSCVDCGNSNPIVLEFDHLQDKKYNVSEMMSLSWNTIQREISKCVIRCANCHRIKTALESNWYKDLV